MAACGDRAMRRRVRELKRAFIAPGVVKKDALGGRLEAFSGQRVPVTASVYPVHGEWKRTEGGTVYRERRTAYLPEDAPIRPGDGFGFSGEEVTWRCVSLERWAGHAVAVLERITP